MSLFAEMPAGTRPMAAWPTSRTTVVGVMGFPVRHSLSPLLHNAAFGVMGLDWSYVAFEVPPGSLEGAVAGAAMLGLRGLSVTMPHKDAASRLAGRRSSRVRRLGAANTLVFEDGAVFAENSDGDGLLDDLREGARFDPAGRRCGVIGAGGAGRAAVLALAEAGAEQIIIVNRTVTPAWRSAALAPKVARVGRPVELCDLDLIVQATPVAMTSQDHSKEPPAVDAPIEGASAAVAGVDPSRFGAGQLVVDLVYDPPLTPFLLEARRQGATTRNGLGMLVHQAAHQIRLWTGSQPPLGVMWAVVGGDELRAGGTGPAPEAGGAGEAGEAGTAGSSGEAGVPPA